MNEKTQDRERSKRNWASPVPSASGTWATPSRRLSLEEVHSLTKIDPWFLVQIEEIVKIELS
jgi:carbamoyl-phosphate synthase large subunit